MPRPNNDMVRTNVYLPRKVRDVYRKLADKTGTPMAEMLREDLTHGLKRRIAALKTATSETNQ